MKFATILNTSVGQKIIMAVTGVFLMIFLVVHCYVNANILFANGRENFNRAANFMGTNLLIRVSEVILFIGLLLHIYKGFSLYFHNKSKRKVSYKVSAPAHLSPWYSRSMTLLGTLILFFLIIHLAHFWIPSRFGVLEEVKYNNLTTHNLYKEMQHVFSNLSIVILYVLGCISLSWHLIHGFQSAFRTFGVNNKSFTPIIKIVGYSFSIIIPLIFASMPISMYLNIYIDLGNINLLF